MTKMVTFYFLDLDLLIGKETLLFLTYRKYDPSSKFIREHLSSKLNAP